VANEKDEMDYLLAAFNSGDILSVGEPADKKLGLSIDVNDPIGVDFKKVVNPNIYLLISRFLNIIHGLPNVSSSLRYVVDTVIHSIDEGVNARSIIADYTNSNIEQACIDVIVEIAQKLPRNVPKWVNSDDLLKYASRDEGEKKESQKAWKNACKLTSEHVALISTLLTIMRVMPNAPKELLSAIKKADGRTIYSTYREKVQFHIMLDTQSNDAFVKQMLTIIYALLA
jgi:hypothetical protein